MDSLISELVQDKEVKEELKTQMLLTLKSVEFKAKFKKTFTDEIQRDLLDHFDELMDEVWDIVRKQFKKTIKENFKIVLIPKK